MNIKQQIVFQLSQLKYKIFTKDKIDFLIAGTQKGGTSALHTYLQKTPDINMYKMKEFHFFDNDQYFKKNTRLLEI